MTKWKNSPDPAHTGFALANNTNKSFYNYLEDHPERARRFGSAMSAFFDGSAYHSSFVVNHYPWDSVRTMVDVGGSEGTICKVIATKHSNISFTVQDLPVVVKDLQDQLEPAYQGSIQYMAHDFFEVQPVKDADIYFFRMIFHNWADQYAIKILQSLVPALKPGARILINDNVLPQPGALSAWQERRLRSMDLTMTEIQNARERDADDWEKLLQASDSRFQFTGIKRPEGSTLSLIEALWKPS